MSAILEVRGLTKQYENSDFCLNNVSFSIPSGTIMGFVGENGAGKTTTIGCMLGTLLKDGGSVTMLGKEMDDKAVGIRDKIGVVYDTSPFPERLTPVQISKALRHIYTNWDNDLFKEYLDKFKLPKETKIRTFSRGMTMKLSIAVALSHHPKLLILDEATSGLDPIVRDDILDVLLGFVGDESHSVLLSSHITSDLEKIADYITFIHNGSIMFSAQKDVLKYGYGVMRLTAARFDAIDKQDVLAVRKHDYQIDVLVSDKVAIAKKYPGTVIDNVTVEEIMLMLVKGEKR